MVDYMLFEVDEPPRKAPRVVASSKQSRDERMRARLAEGLEEPIASDNVGFRILSKMGYRPGEDESTPLAPNLEPRKRSGIGVAESEARSKAAEAVAWEVRQGQFRSASRDNAMAVANRRATRRARHAIQDLDERKGLPRHSLWPAPEDNNEEDGFETQLRAAVKYLLDEHQFQLSGKQFEVENDKKVELEMRELIEEEVT